MPYDLPGKLASAVIDALRKHAGDTMNRPALQAGGAAHEAAAQAVAAIIASDMLGWHFAGDTDDTPVLVDGHTRTQDMAIIAGLVGRAVGLGRRRLDPTDDDDDDDDIPWASPGTWRSPDDLD